MNMHLQPNDIVTVSFFSEGTDPNECVATEPVEVIDFDLCCACMTTTDPQGFPTGLANFTLRRRGGIGLCSAPEVRRVRVPGPDGRQAVPDHGYDRCET